MLTAPKQEQLPGPSSDPPPSAQPSVLPKEAGRTARSPGSGPATSAFSCSPSISGRVERHHCEGVSSPPASADLDSLALSGLRHCSQGFPVFPEAALPTSSKEATGLGSRPFYHLLALPSCWASVFLSVNYWGEWENLHLNKTAR